MTTIRVQRQIEELMEQMFPGLDIAAITPTDPVNDETDVYLIEMEDGREYWAFDDQSDIRMLSKNSIYADPADAYEALEALRESLAQEEAALPQESLAQADEAQTGLENPGEAVLTSGMNVADYIANVQLNREQIRAKNKETLMGLINSTSIDEAAKQQAIQDMIDLTEIAEKENAAETLLMAKGFLDPVVSITGDKVDVVINASSITDPQRAQIEDIVKRKTEVGADQIVITLLKLEE